MASVTMHISEGHGFLGLSVQVLFFSATFIYIPRVCLQIFTCRVSCLPFLLPNHFLPFSPLFIFPFSLNCGRLKSSLDTYRGVIYWFLPDCLPPSP